MTSLDNVTHSFGKCSCGWVHEQDTSYPYMFTTEVGMNYPGGEISKNRLWNGGDRRKGMNKVAKQWAGDLKNGLKMALIAEGYKSEKMKLCLPLTLTVACKFTNKSHALDPQNLVELVADCVQDVTGLNDRDYEIVTKANNYGVGIPVIVVWVDVGVSVQA